MARQSGQRLGSLVKPRLAKNSCSPTVKAKLAPQSRQVRVLSVYTPRLLGQVVGTARSARGTKRSEQEAVRRFPRHWAGCRIHYHFSDHSTIITIGSTGPAPPE